MNTVISAFIAASLTLASCSTTNASSSTESKGGSKLHVETYVGSEKGFLVTSNLILGPTEAVLIDSQFIKSDAKQVVSMIQKSGRRLKTVFVTHGHPDHYFGIETLRAAFPDARYVATAETIADIKATGSGKLGYWKGVYADEMPAAVPQVDQVNANSDLNVDGETLILKQIAPGESEHASVIIAPSLKAAFTGDMLYDQVHLWLAEAVGHTESWKSNLNALKANTGVETLYVGHKKFNRAANKSLINENISYIDRAVKIFGQAQTAEQGATQIKAAFPEYSLPIIADIAAGSFVPKK